MGIILDSINFSNEFEPTDTTWLLANIGEKITATIDFTVRADDIPNGSTTTITLQYLIHSQAVQMEEDIRLLKRYQRQLLELMQH